MDQSNRSVIATTFTAESISIGIHPGPMLVTLDSREGLRAWCDFLVKHQEELGCRVA